MKFTEHEYHKLLIGLSHWKNELDWKHPAYHEVEALEQKLLNNKQELVE